MIETLEGLKNAEAIAKVPGVTAIFAASGDLGNFTGYRQGTPDYERRSISCTMRPSRRGSAVRSFAWRDRPDFTCFQAGSETAAIAGWPRSSAARQHAGKAGGRTVRRTSQMRHCDNC